MSNTTNEKLPAEESDSTPGITALVQDTKIILPLHIGALLEGSYTLFFTTNCEEHYKREKNDGIINYEQWIKHLYKTYLIFQKITNYESITSADKVELESSNQDPIQALYRTHVDQFTINDLVVNTLKTDAKMLLSLLQNNFIDILLDKRTQIGVVDGYKSPELRYHAKIFDKCLLNYSLLANTILNLQNGKKLTSKQHKILTKSPFYFVRLFVNDHKTEIDAAVDESLRPLYPLQLDDEQKRDVKAEIDVINNNATSSFEKLEQARSLAAWHKFFTTSNSELTRIKELKQQMKRNTIEEMEKEIEKEKTAWINQFLCRSDA